MVEAVHSAGTHSVFDHVAVPSLPDGGGSVVDRIKPAGVLPLVEKLIRYVRHSVFGEDVHQDGGSQESSLEAVVMRGEILPKTFDGGILRGTFNYSGLEGEEGWGLHGVQNPCLELTS